MDDEDWRAWWNIAQSDSTATFFHSPLWAKVAEATGCDPAPQFPSTGQRDAVFPAVRETTSVSKLGATLNISILHSTFAGCYGGIIAKDNATDAGEFYQEVKDMADVVNVVGNPLRSEFDLDWDSSEDFTQILDLSGGMDEVENGFTKSRQKGIDAARDKGVTVREANSESDWKTYFEAYQDSLERWDNPTSNYDWPIFERIYDLGQEYPDHISLKLACVEGNIASGAIIFSWNQHVDYWHGASFSEYFDYNPNDLLQYSIIEDAIDAGYRWYDFNPSGGHEGVIQFKSEFGPERMKIYRRTHTDPKIEFASMIKEKLGL
ncbi:peptidoglycan bridge formation glycyltransferase FemA/FemB family protein [Halobacterium sp. CBA1126]|uniref:lipid II:glycine glycyltransferase FemX n=1 Tax=Halobacterium sp. CBA1126 TaxID=2668074 RepID=UPI0012FC7C7F|nr:peptidoglycan bridge formation glycyltransferase FemA/FemB family protein [Halobacterium sp. CBA1126]MUV59841.1 peptidoglycan bridge formation glycyltransferase FemA/FemB family protein [Halobacterium sp. CBA1126]